MRLHSVYPLSLSLFSIGNTDSDAFAVLRLRKVSKLLRAANNEEDLDVEIKECFVTCHSLEQLVHDR